MLLFRLLWKSLYVLKSTGKHDFALLNRVTLKIRLGPTYCLRVKFADSIESDMNVVMSSD